ncbi:hypothetical protein HYS97_02530 [Candidatus Daviesbacteria bacterium]|nr:hypothetical protein [Candidatus Daviesbacteria bacterium]
MSIQRPPDRSIAVYAELRNPHIKPITVGEFSRTLQIIAGRDFESFSPDRVAAHVIATVTGDSPYGARMGVVKPIVAQALYSPAEFEGFAFKTSFGEAQESARLEREYASPAYADEKARRIAEKPNRLRPDYISGEMEVDEVRRHITYAAAYADLALIINRIGSSFPNVGVEDILRLSEVGHFFSGKWNGTGLNATFTDPDIRRFGVELQQFVERVWNAPHREDTATPLSEAQLFPPRYP